MNKLLLPFVLTLFILSHASAQAPKGINYQGVARDNEGKAIVVKNISVRISILKGSANGEVEYSETHKPQTNQFGLFSLIIGQGIAGTGSFAFISWAIGNKWLQIEIDPEGGSSFQLAGSQQLMSVPYAFYAEYSGNGANLAAGQGIAINDGVISNTGDGDNSETNEIQTLSNTSTADGHSLSISGGNTVTLKTTLDQVLTSNPDAGTKRIQNVGAPVNNTDVATKRYVDEQHALDLDTDPTNELQNLAEVLTKGNDAGGKQIKNIVAPTDASDAATKNYVDTQHALDLDQSITNEIQDLTLNTGTNVLKISNNSNATDINLTPYKQTLTYTPATNNLAISGGNNVTISSTLTQVLTTNPNAGAIRIQNVGTPTVNTDATTKGYVDNAIATTFAFKTNFNFTNSSGSTVNDQEMIFTTEEFDSFNVLASNAFTAAENGTYVFMVDGVYNTSSAGGQISLLYNSIKRPISIVVPFGSTVPRYNATFMFQLTAGQTVKIIGDSVLNGASFTGTFFGYKL
jgi:hypothetical protein